MVKHYKRRRSCCILPAMIAAPLANPRRASRTRQYRAHKRRQGERWEDAQRAVAAELERRFIGEREAWRRWMASERTED